MQEQLVPDPVATPCEYRDQYSVGDPQSPKTGCSRFCELLHGVAISNDVSKRFGSISSLLGPTGHYERLSFWTHFVGAVLFAIYAIVRQVLVRDDARLAGGLTSAAAWTISAVFLTSSLYHCTAPDLNFAMVTRVLDYAAIYIGITVTTTADIAVATRGFVNVPMQTIVDLPFSAVILIVFFVWRRSRLSGESTWTKHEITSRSKDGCLLGRGLFSYGHRDLAHIQMRQATSMLLFGSYFMIVPAAMEVLGHGVARVVLALQVSAFVTVALGMAIDRVFEFPDGHLVEGSMTCLACPSDGAPGWGAVLNSHALWHLVAMVSAGLTVVSREYALAYS
jgi:predicted membrane channel-forming protein YqfA (hemolysin III family)